MLEIRIIWRNPMNRFTLILFALIALTSIDASTSKAGEKCDCTSIAGLWNFIDKEAHIGTFINIPKNCKAVRMQQIPSQNPVEGFPTDRVVCEDGKFRMQYRFPKGYVDNQGKKAIYPLTPEVAKGLRGDICKNADGTLSIGMDLFGKGCGTAHFEKIPESEILRD